MSLVVNNISKQYGSFTALHSLSFEMQKPGVYALLGTNGAGKTTAIRMILGMLSKNSGEVLWNGNPISPIKDRVGYLAEERGLYPKYKIIDQLAYFAKLKGVSKADFVKSADYWLNRFDISEYRNKTADQLSKGNQQKVQLTAALISDPEILILDEPLSGLDPVNADLFKDIISEQVAKHKYIIMSSHQMELIESFCTELTILHHGTAVLQGNLAEIKKASGRVNLSVKCDGDIMPLAQRSGLVPIEVAADKIEFKVENEQQAKNFLKKIVESDITLVQYELREPSLHEIFVNSVENFGFEAGEGEKI